MAAARSCMSKPDLSFLNLTLKRKQKYPQNKEGSEGSIQLLNSRLAQKASVKTKTNLPMQHTLYFQKSSAQVSSLPCALEGVFVMCCKANKLG